MPQRRDAGYNAGMDAQVYLFDPATMLPSGGKGLATLDANVPTPLRWAAWHPDGHQCLLVGNRGVAVRYRPDASGNTSWEEIDTGTTRNLRGVAFSPNAEQALLVGNRGAAPEVAGGHAVTVDPFEVDDIAIGIQRVLETSAESVEKAFRHASQFTWAASAARTVSLYREVLNG